MLAKRLFRYRTFSNTQHEIARDIREMTGWRAQGCVGVGNEERKGYCYNGS